MSWWNVGAAAVSAAGTIYGSNRAGNIQKDTAKKNNTLQQQMLGTQLAMNEPQRALGYGALSDLSTLYGYGLPAYTPLNQLMNGGYPGNFTLGAGGGQSRNWLDPMGGDKGLGVINSTLFGGKKNPRFSYSNGIVTVDGKAGGAYGGVINLADGTVTVYRPGTAIRDDVLSKQATDALRSGSTVDGKRWGRIGAAITNLQANGFKYSERTPGQVASQTPGVQGPGSMDRFFTSPDYQFRLNEGTRNIGNSFAARGGAASGNALRELANFNSGLAAGEYNNYVNRLFRMAGMGESATNNATDALQVGTKNMMNNNSAIGDARASGVLATTGALTGLANSFASIYANRRSASPQTYWQPGAAELPGGGSINPNLPYIGG